MGLDNCDDSSVMKALTVLDCFRSGENELGVTELARRTGIPKSTVHRMCAALSAASYLVRTEHRAYRLGLRVFELGSAALVPADARRDASRFLQQLTVLSGETSHLGVLDGNDVVYIDKIETPRSCAMPSRVGQRNPAHATGLGKALLAGNGIVLAALLRKAPLRAFTPNTITDAVRLRAEIADVQREGIAYDREERVVGTICIAAPVRNHRGDVVSAMSISGPSKRMSQQRLVELAPVVRQAAAMLSSELGWQGRRSAGHVAS